MSFLFYGKTFAINYNFCMEKINIIVVVFFIELFADLIVSKLFHIKTKFVYLLLLQLPKICATIVGVFYSSVFWLVLLVNILSKMLSIFFLNDTLKLKKYVGMLFSEYIILFSIMGFSEFLILWLKGSYRIIFKQNFPLNCDYIAIFGIFLYIFAFFFLMRILPKNKNFGRFLVEVSLSRNSKHINVYGLIDSGNSLIDPVTKQPVIILSKKSFSKLFSKSELEKMLKNECRKIECETISGENFKIPIFENILVKLKFENEFVESKCVVGYAGIKFENGEYDCLLNRDVL